MVRSFAKPAQVPSGTFAHLRSAQGLPSRPVLLYQFGLKLVACGQALDEPGPRRAGDGSRFAGCGTIFGVFGSSDILGGIASI